MISDIYTNTNVHISPWTRLIFIQSWSIKTQYSPLKFEAIPLSDAQIFIGIHKKNLNKKLNKEKK